MYDDDNNDNNNDDISDSDGDDNVYLNYHRTQGHVVHGDLNGY